MFQSNIFRIRKVARPTLSRVIISTLIWLTACYAFFPLRSFPFSGELAHLVDYPMLRAFFKLRGNIEPPSEVVIVSIKPEALENKDEKTYFTQLRKKLSELLETISQYKPKKVIIDVRFFDQVDPEIDARLAKAISLQPTYLPVFRVDTTGLENKVTLNPDDKWLRSNPLFENNAAGLFDGTVSIFDNTVYKFWFNYEHKNHYAPLARIVYGDKIQADVQPNPGDFINYYGDRGTIKKVLIDQVINNELPNADSAFKDKYVLIGAETEIAAYGRMQRPDLFDTTLGSGLTKSYYGVEIHATVLGNILQKNWIRKFSSRTHLIIFGFLAIAISMIILGLSRWNATKFCIIICPILIALSYLLFLQYYYVPVGGLILVSFMALLLNGKAN